VLGRKAPPVGALKLIVEAMARGETQPQASSFGHQTACELLGLTGDGAATGHRNLLLAELARASDKRAQVIARAMVLGAAEHGARDEHVWQAVEEHDRLHYGILLAARYLAWLAVHTGYSLSDIEAEVAAHAVGEAAGGGTISDVAVKLGLSRNTVRRFARAAPWSPGKGHDTPAQFGRVRGENALIQVWVTIR
jgi:hypothetical protein